MKVLVVEDDRIVGQYVQRGLVEQQYHVDLVGDGLEALRLISGGHYDLVVLDLRLPGMTGLEVLRTIRDRGVTTPILVLTAQDAVDYKVEALRSGADDYVTKPFAFEELLARLRALLRRGGAAGSPVLEVADLRLDPQTRTVTRAGRRIDLTAKEFALLEFFLRQPGRVLSRALIAQHVWGVSFDTFSNVIDVYVNYVRRKIDADFEPKLLHTVRGTGYVLKVPDRPA
jgi:two-component system copper resistance phosphate regulon response regulator CusR